MHCPLVELVGLPLNVLFADPDSLAHARKALKGGSAEVKVALVAPFHVSDDDAYVVLPEDIAVELRDIFADGDLDLLREAMREGIVARGTIEQVDKTRTLVTDDAVVVSTLLEKAPPAQTLRMAGAEDTLKRINALPAARVTLQSALADARGLAAMCRKTEFVGASWSPPKGRPDLIGVEPTYVWSAPLPGGGSRVQAALFSEDDEAVLVLRPLDLRPALSVVQPVP